MIVDDLMRTVKGTKFTRALPPYPPARKVFAICICPLKREELSREMLFRQRLTDWHGAPEIRPTTLIVGGALIGSIEEPDRWPG